MSEQLSFTDLIQRVREADAEAATELVRRYEPAVRRAVRIRLVDARVRRFLDSMDVCQSVLGSFFVRVASGEYEIETPEHLVKLLMAMVRNKLYKQVRWLQAKQRDYRRDQTGEEGRTQLLGREPDPAEQLAAQDYYDEVLRLLTPEDRLLLERREHGHAWGEIAVEVGGTPEALRKRLSRALAEAARQLNPPEVDHA